MSKENTARNKAATAVRHAKRMHKQTHKSHPASIDAGHTFDVPGLKVPRGTARNLRRQHLQRAYAKRMAAALAS